MILRRFVRGNPMWWLVAPYCFLFLRPPSWSVERVPLLLDPCGRASFGGRAFPQSGWGVDAARGCEQVERPFGAGRLLTHDQLTTSITTVIATVPRCPRRQRIMQTLPAEERFSSHRQPRRVSVLPFRRDASLMSPSNVQPSAVSHPHILKFYF